MFANKLRVSRLKASQREILFVEVPEEFLMQSLEHRSVDILLEQALSEVAQDMSSFSWNDWSESTPQEEIKGFAYE